MIYGMIALISGFALGLMAGNLIFLNEIWKVLKNIEKSVK